MVKIRSLGNRELQQVLGLLEQNSAEEFHYPALQRLKDLYMPIHGINHLLPLPLKLLPEIYVAVDGSLLLGLVLLSRDGHRTDRWKVEQVLINPDISETYDVGRQLMDYVMNRLGAMGVETFVAYVDIHHEAGLSLLKNCGFRHCTKMHTYQWQGKIESSGAGRHISGLREARGADRFRLQELYSETLTPDVRLSLRKSANDLYPSGVTRWQHRCQGHFFKRWVVSARNEDYLIGSVAISTENHRQFKVSLLAAPAWEAGLDDLLGFAMQQVGKNTTNPEITVDVYDFQKAKMAALEKAQFERTWTTEIVVRDFWTPLQDASRAQNPILFFSKSGKTSPA